MGIQSSVAMFSTLTKINLIIKESNDIEKLLNDSLNVKVPAEELRLPNTLYPSHYKLWIHPIVDEYGENNFTFTGRVKIQVDCLEETNKIILNWDDLNITDSDIRVYTVRHIESNSDSLKTQSEPKVHNISRRQAEDDDPVTSSDDSTTSGLPPDFFTTDIESTEETTTTEETDGTTVETTDPTLDTTTIEVAETTTERRIITSEITPLPIKEIDRNEE
ncbi:hypothetical protein NQ318_007892 [Aromia moschata]|uniref:Aminopeptidase N-like N-terminal domain-containing protein n=1 Tax=Aromia moschata TaxID=1265417 RepID=A0AAV8XPT9_9CUCU|nr:hypothetical protein NQ318_007892 [Aromia moschata]